ncbi:large ribosomal subunit protein bL35m [Cydia splendana]|uniref:large ribosomal subunit protein bL35m n=1 Tax=Cydia splendana TaxID=1100963 RepID=UPI002143C1E3
MLRTLISAARCIRPLALQQCKAARIARDVRSFTTLHRQVYNVPACKSLISNSQILQIANNISPMPVRTVTKFSLKKGKRKTVKAAVKRFFRLHWGIWIRPMIGRHKKMWKKSPPQRRRLRQHVFTNGTQTKLLDKMVTKCWKKPKYYVEDPYTPYHTRDEFYATRRKPAVRT